MSKIMPIAYIDLKRYFGKIGGGYFLRVTLANSQQCKTFFTFDKKMINAAKNIDTCEVLAP